MLGHVSHNMAFVSLFDLTSKNSFDLLLLPISSTLLTLSFELLLKPLALLGRLLLLFRQLFLCSQRSETLLIRFALEAIIVLLYLGNCFRIISAEKLFELR